MVRKYMLCGSSSFPGVSVLVCNETIFHIHTFRKSVMGYICFRSGGLSYRKNFIYQLCRKNGKGISLGVVV